MPQTFVCSVPYCIMAWWWPECMPQTFVCSVPYCIMALEIVLGTKQALRKLLRVNELGYWGYTDGRLNLCPGRTHKIIKPEARRNSTWYATWC